MDQSDRQVIIIGTCTAQDQALARFIEEKIEASCLISESFKGFLVGNRLGAIKRKLLLYDCFGKSQERLLDFLGRYLETVSSGRLLILFNLLHENNIEKEALQHGVNGFLYEQDSLDTFVKSINAVFDGEAWVSRKKMTECLYSKKASENNLVDLTLRELQILKTLAKGHSNERIAADLYISPHTVKTHISHIFAKINVHNRRQAALWADTHL